MKQNKQYGLLTIYKPKQPIYPNAADASYFIGKLLDILTAVASGVGLISAMAFLITIS